MEQNKVVNYISPDAKIGRNVKIWHFSYVGSNTEIGDNVSIGSLTHIDYNVKIGENTRIEGSVYIPPLKLNISILILWKKCICRTSSGVH